MQKEGVSDQTRLSLFMVRRSFRIERTVNATVNHHPFASRGAPGPVAIPRTAPPRRASAAGTGARRIPRGWRVRCRSLRSLSRLGSAFDGPNRASCTCKPALRYACKTLAHRGAYVRNANIHVKTPLYATHIHLSARAKICICVDVCKVVHLHRCMYEHTYLIDVYVA